MPTDYLKESIKYDCCSSECTNLITLVGQHRVLATDEARRNGEEPPEWYDWVVEELSNIRSKFNDLADQYFKLHKSHQKSLNEDGINNLMNAIVGSWATDYEVALCSDDKNKDKKLDKLKDEADLMSSAYATVNIDDSIIKQIEKAHQQFKKTAHDRFFYILADTKFVDKRRASGVFADYCDDSMRTKCPLCGGNLYSKKVKSNLYVVKCTNCALSEMVRIIS